MKTEIYDLNKETSAAAKEKAIARCGEIIRAGGIVVFPTETVYGLGANALNPDAVKKIFLAKGRPQDNPLIVHISDFSMVKDLVKTVPEKAKALAEAYWPGPMTMIMQRADVIGNTVTAGLDTVGIRFPSHKVAQAFIAASGCPIAAPSANISGRPSPTRGQHVIEDMDGKADAILIADESDVGLESTVIDMTSATPTVLRPGGITVDAIKKVIGDAAVSPNATKPIIPKEVRSPGMKYKHYAPKGDMVIARGTPSQIVEKITAAVDKLDDGTHTAILATDETMAQYHSGLIVSLGSRSNPAEMSHNLFDCLRSFDEMGVTHIFAEDIEMTNETLALINRLYKAAGYTFI